MNARNLSRFALVLLLAFVSAPATRPQEQDKSLKPDRAKALRQKYSGFDDRKSDQSGREPQNGEEWFARGYEFHNSDRYPEAIVAFKLAADLGYRRGTAMYNIACGYSLLNDKDNAISWLVRALNNDFDSPELLARDSDLDPIRTDPRFKTILSSVIVVDNDGERNAKRKADRLTQANLDFARLEGESSRDGQEWANVGARLLMLRDLERATLVLNRAVGYLDYQGSSAMYNLACAYSLKGDREAGINWLDKAVKAGFDGPEKLRNDPDLNNLRNDSRFAGIEKLSNTLSLAQFRRNNYDSDKDEYSKERWAPAVELYESFVKTNPSSGRAWFNLGYALHYSREHQKAIAAFEHAVALGYQKPTSTYNVACGYAMLNERDSAFTWLDRALAAGFDSVGDFSWDKDLDNLRSDPRFKRFVDNANYNSKMRRKE